MNNDQIQTIADDFGRGPARWFQGGEGRASLNFAAANGFPLGAYDFFLQGFAEAWCLQGLDNRGMWPQQPAPAAGFSWWDHADDLIAFLDYRAAVGGAPLPLVGMGHSIGGVVTLMAALQRPDLFRALVLMDPATVPPLVAVPDTGGAAEQAFEKLVRMTTRRRDQWDSVAEFRDYLPTRAVYSRFVPAALDDYARAGLRPADSGWQLAYDRLWEAHNFATTPDIAPLLAAVTVPTLLLWGEQSPMYSVEGVARAAAGFSPCVTARRVPGAGHMIPQECPAEAQRLIVEWLASDPVLNGAGVVPDSPV